MGNFWPVCISSPEMTSLGIGSYSNVQSAYALGPIFPHTILKTRYESPTRFFWFTPF